MVCNKQTERKQSRVETRETSTDELQSGHLGYLSICVTAFISTSNVENIYLNWSITMCLERNIILNSVRQHNHFITQGNYKATCFDYRLVILRPILSIVSQDVTHTLGSHRVYIHGIHQIKSFVPMAWRARNYKATCFDYRLVILRPILSIVSQDAMHTLGSQSVHSILWHNWKIGLYYSR